MRNEGRPSQPCPVEWLSRPRDRPGAKLMAVFCLAWLSACASPPSVPEPTASGRSPAGASASTGVVPRQTARYTLPTASDICAAVRRTGLDIVATKPEQDAGWVSRCKVDIASKGRRPRKLPYTLRVEVQTFRDAALAERLYVSSKTTDWQRGHSAFSGAATQRAEIDQLGHARSGAQYDEGYYAYFPDHQVAGAKNSESVLSLRKGNLIITFDLLAGDLTGSTVS